MIEPGEVLVIDEKALNIALNKGNFLVKAMLNQLIMLLREKSKEVNEDMQPAVINYKLTLLQNVFENIKNSIKKYVENGHVQENQKETLAKILEACNLALKLGKFQTARHH